MLPIPSCRRQQQALLASWEDCRVPWGTGLGGDTPSLRACLMLGLSPVLGNCEATLFLPLYLFQ